jgi:uncharacterized caspase-like protein
MNKARVFTDGRKSMRGSFPNCKTQTWRAFWAFLLAVSISNFPATAQIGGVGSKHVKKPAPQREVQDAIVPPASGSLPAGYYALVIGNNDYRYLPKLETAVNDATEVASLLHDNYGFVAPKVLLNASRDEILTQLNVFRRTLPENSNLLIYYAGHGHKDRDTKKAYWLPVDARADSDVNWISASTITEEISAIRAPHILVISDSCYSGELVRSAPIAINPSDRNIYLKRMLESPSRTLMASGRDEPVADSGAAGHSKFAYVLIESLRRMDEDRFTAGDLFQRFIQPWVSGGSDQVPQYSVIQNSGHAYGDFVFSRLRGVDPPVQPPIGDDIIPAKEVHPIPPTQPPASQEAVAVFATLHRYEDAYESMDINMLKAVWPSLTRDQIDKLKAGFRGAQAVKVQLLQCDTATTSGDTARARCAQSMAYTRDGRRQPADTLPVEITLKRATDGGWLVSDVRIR